MAKPSIKNPENSFNFQLNPPIKFKKSLEFNPLNSTPSTEFTIKSTKVNPQNQESIFKLKKMVEFPENGDINSLKLGFLISVDDTMKNNNLCFILFGGIQRSDSSFIPRTLCSAESSAVAEFADAKPETGDVPRLRGGANSSNNAIKSLLLDYCFGTTGISDTTLSPRAISSVRNCAVKKHANGETGNGHRPYQNGAVHHQANGVHENGVHNTGNNSSNDGGNGNGNDNAGNAGPNGNGNNGRVIMPYPLVYDRYPPITIERYQWVRNGRNNVIRKHDIHTNLFARHFDSWQDVARAIRILWQQIIFNNNSNVPGLASIMDPCLDSCPGCVADFGYYLDNGHFVRFDWRVNPWRSIRAFVSKVVVHGENVD